MLFSSFLFLSLSSCLRSFSTSLSIYDSIFPFLSPSFSATASDSTVIQYIASTSFKSSFKVSYKLDLGEGLSRENRLRFRLSETNLHFLIKAFDFNHPKLFGRRWIVSVLLFLYRTVSVSALSGDQVPSLMGIGGNSSGWASEYCSKGPGF